MDEELRLRIRTTDEGSSSVVRNFNQTIDETGKKTEETRGKLKGLEETTGGLGVSFSSLKKTIGEIAVTYGLLTVKKANDEIQKITNPAYDPEGFHGYETYMDYWKGINNELRQQDEIVTAIKPNVNGLADSYLGFLDKTDAKLKQQIDTIEAFEAKQREWASISSSIGHSFTDTFVDSIMGDKDAFKHLGENLVKMVLEGWVHRLVTQPFIMPLINSMSGVFGYGGAGGAAGSAGTGSGIDIVNMYIGDDPGKNGLGYQIVQQPLITPGSALAGIGAGILAYQYSGPWSAAGAGLGTAFGGAGGGFGLGMMAAAISGELEEALGKSNPEIPSFDLLWEVIDGKVRNVADTWSHMAKNDEVFNAAQEFVQSTTDFFKRLSTVAGNSELEMPDWTFGMHGIGDDIKGILNQSTAQAVIKAVFGEWGNLEEVFGSEFHRQIQTLFMNTLGQNLGMFAFGNDREVFQNYMNWKFGQFTSMPPEEAMAAFEDWMAGQAIFSPIGRPGIRSSTIFDLFQSVNPDADFNSPETFQQLEQFAKTAVPGWFTRGQIALGSENSQTPWTEFFTGVDQQITDIFNMVTTGMGQAFADSLGTGAFQTFEQNIKKSIMGTVEQSLIQSFAEQNLIPIIFKPLYGSSGHPVITEILDQYQAGDITLDQAQGYLGSVFSELNTTLQGFEPVWDLLNTAFQGLTQALGLNTTAVQSNTDAVLGPVNSFLASLDTGPLAPVQSIARMANLESSFYTDAFADPSKFQQYANFMTSSWLPYLQSTSQSYGEDVAAIRAGVEAMPWVAEAQGLTPTAADIGTEVAKAMSPMLLDIKESLGPVTIQMVVDGQIIKETVMKSLDDPDVVQKTRSRV
ncbi:MAG: hypothetical protein AB1847_16635 [bacterium]